jgi:hypothetical protein
LPAVYEARNDLVALTFVNLEMMVADVTRDEVVDVLIYSVNGFGLAVLAPEGEVLEFEAEVGLFVDLADGGLFRGFAGFDAGR